jgi:hypothetical protein
MNLSSWIPEGAGLVAILGSAAKAGSVWRGWRERKRAEKAANDLRDWTGVNPGMVNSWRLTLAPEDDPASTTVILHLADLTAARSLRMWVERDGMLARVPTLDELAVIRSRQQQPRG